MFSAVFPRTSLPRNLAVGQFHNFLPNGAQVHEPIQRSRCSVATHRYWCPRTPGLRFWLLLHRLQPRLPHKKGAIATHSSPFFLHLFVFKNILVRRCPRRNSGFKCGSAVDLLQLSMAAERRIGKGLPEGV